MSIGSAGPPIKGWVLYDGDCGFCSRWVPRWAGVMRRRGFAIAPLQSPWVGEKTGLSLEELSTDIRLLFTDGRLLKGADVYRHVLKRIWWAMPLGVLMSLPVARQVVDFCYRRFADNRYWISRTCHMPAKPPTFDVKPRKD